MYKFLLILIRKTRQKKFRLKNFDYEENSVEEIMEKIQMEKNSDYEGNFDEEIMEKIQMEKKV